MLVVVGLRLDILKDVVFLICVLGEYTQVFKLFDFDHLDELLAHLPVVLSNVLVRVKGGQITPFLLELHVHFANAVDRVSLLPDQLQIGLLL